MAIYGTSGLAKHIFCSLVVVGSFRTKLRPMFWCQREPSRRQTSRRPLSDSYYFTISAWSSFPTIALNSVGIQNSSVGAVLVELVHHAFHVGGSQLALVICTTWREFHFRDPQAAVSCQDWPLPIRVTSKLHRILPIARRSQLVY
jgi:hypothetical protein